MSRPEPGQASERRVVCVLFADIAGFTAMSEKLDPETVTDAMNEVFTALGAEVEAVGGYVDKVIGDSLMALFGAPVAHEDDALRAVRAAVAMHRAMALREDAARRLLGKPARLRIGIHSGLVVWGSVGPPGQARPTVMGDAVNLASRLQRAAPEGGVLVSDAVCRQVRGVYICRPLEPIVVKGKAEPVAVYEIVGERERAEPVARPPFVDREDDLNQLDDLLARASRGRVQVAVVIGEPGVGKTRLVDEFTRRLPPDVVLLQATCPPYGGASLGPLADLFRQLANLQGQVSLEDVVARIPFGERAPQAAAVLSRLFDLTEVPAGHEVSHETALLVAAEAIRRMITRPTVVWIEDLQWADAGSREVLPFIVDRMVDAPMLLVGTLRSDAEPLAWGRRTALTTLQLEPLADADARALLAAVLGARLPGPAEEALVARAAGNPFFLNEIVAMLRSSGTLVQDDRGRWKVVGPVANMLPDTVHGAVRARLDRLPPDLRGVVQIAAVAGAQFRQSLLAALYPEADVAEALRALEDAYMIRRRDPLAADPECTFVHPLLREVAYTSMLARQRAAVHLEIAEAMERLYPGHLDELAKTIGTHYAHGSSPERALPYLVRAGEHAAARYATREAIELLESARAIAEGTGHAEQCLPACELLGELYLRVQDRGPKAWFEVWELVRTHVDPEVDPTRRARAAIRVAHACAADNRIDEAQRHLQEAEGLVPPGDPLWSDFHRVRSQILIMESEYRAALDAALQAVAIANERGALQDRSRAYAAVAHPAILPLLGDRGTRMMRDWVAEASETGDERLLIEARHFFISDVWTRGVVDSDLMATAEAALRKAEEHGWTRDEVVLSMLLGWSYYLVGRWLEAEARIQHAHGLVTAQGGRVHAHYVILLPLFRGNLALGAGRLDEAREIFEEALVHAGFHAPIWLNHDLARCLAMQGDVGAAEAAMARALEARDRLRCIICGCQASGVAAEFFATLGDGARAEALAAEADDVAREIGHATTRIRVLRARARVALMGGNAVQAVAQAEEAVGLGAAMPLLQPLEHGQSLLVLGAARRAAGEHDRALAAWDEARALFDRLGAAWHLRQVDAARQRAGVAR